MADVPVPTGPSVSELSSGATKRDFLAIGGGWEGAESTSRETAKWAPDFRSPDQAINWVKPMADARARDRAQNDGYVSGAVAIHRDSIVGAQYILNAQPNAKVLGVSDDYCEELQDAVEARFNLIADSPDCWLDVQGRMTLTGMVRLAVGMFLKTGEVLASVEWLKNKNRPMSTCLQMISPDRLSNPDSAMTAMDTPTMKRGVEIDTYGRPVAYYIRQSFPTEYFDANSYIWKRVPATMAWGRRQIIHIVEQQEPGQNRGISEMAASLKQMRMTSAFQDVTLQNAVINASFAAAIESELPPDIVYQQLGGPGSMVEGAGPFNWMQPSGQFMQALQAYLSGTSNISMDGAKIPHLFPGTKLHMQPMGTPGGVGQDFEKSLLRHICASLGISYEEFSRDYSQTSYSSARASMLATWRFMQSRKKIVADKFATEVYRLWFEEDWNAGNLPRPPGKSKDWFYQSLIKDALTSCEWIGAGRGQIDELKETQAAVLRIQAGLSTYEQEIGRYNGADWRKVFAQRAREEGIIAAKGLNFDLSTKRPGGSTQAPTDPINAGDPKDETAGDKTDDGSGDNSP